MRLINSKPIHLFKGVFVCYYYSTNSFTLAYDAISDLIKSDGKILPCGIKKRAERYLQRRL